MAGDVRLEARGRSAVRRGREARSAERRWLLEAEKGKEMHPPLRAARRNQPCLHLNLSLVRLTSDSGPPEPEVTACALCEPQACGHPSFPSSSYISVALKFRDVSLWRLTTTLWGR